MGEPRGLWELGEGMSQTEEGREMAKLFTKGSPRANTWFGSKSKIFLPLTNLNSGHLF